MTQSNYMALTTVLKDNKISLTENEFKTVLAIINSKTDAADGLNPTAQLIVRIFDQPKLTENQLYLIVDDVNHSVSVARTRSQLLTVLLNSASTTTDVKVVNMVEQLDQKLFTK